MRVRNQHVYVFLIGIVVVLGVAVTLSAEPQEIENARVVLEKIKINRKEDVVRECMSVDDPLIELLQGKQTRLTTPRKGPKTYRPAWRVSRRRGLQPVITTFYSIHSRESVPVLKGATPPEEVFDELFRCRGFGFRQRVDPKLIRIVLAAAQHFESPRVNIISAYRSPKFNDSLAKKGRRVAAESRHTRGQALDFSLSSSPAKEIGRWLWDNFDGGIGTYSKDNFVHVDVGPKRRWTGK
ncbi:MAG: YcbK family protein [Deltaproteobacteria bacterium]|nr:YcbK family protein [Deltaproteobacteria bacterium]